MRSPVSATLVVLFSLQVAAAGPLPSPVPVPPSLDALYPPAAERPVLLLQMLQLDEALSGVVVDVLEDDATGARQNFEAFAAGYAELRGLVPEWADHYPAGPVEALGAALSSGDRGRVLGAVDDVGQACHGCHAATMVPVQQRYRWGDFTAEKVTDPTTGAAVEFSRFKRLLATSMAGVGVDLRQGQTANAVRQFRAFRERFRELEASCQRCHEQGGRIFVAGDIDRLLDEVERALDGPEPVAAEAVAPLVQQIGRESCSKCHLVHAPAAHAQARPH